MSAVGCSIEMQFGSNRPGFRSFSLVCEGGEVLYEVLSELLRAPLVRTHTAISGVCSDKMVPDSRDSQMLSWTGGNIGRPHHATH